MELPMQNCRAGLHFGLFTNTNHSKHLRAIQLPVRSILGGWGVGGLQGVNMLGGSDTAFSIKASHNISMFSNWDRVVHSQTCKLVDPLTQDEDKRPWCTTTHDVKREATCLGELLLGLIPPNMRAFFLSCNKGDEDFILISNQNQPLLNILLNIVSMIQISSGARYLD